MIDTINYFIDELPSLYLEKIMYKLKLRQCICMNTGEIEYQFSTGDILASYDSTINLNITKQKSLKVRCSLHKIIIGHNAYGGSDNILLITNCLKKILEDTFEITLPNVKKWRVTQIDYTLVFDLGNNDNVRLYINSFKNITYRGRVISHYDSANNNGIHIPGQTTVVKFYNKKIEFLQNDFKKVSKIWDNNYLNNFLKKIDGILRIEISVKNKLLKSSITTSRYKKEIYKKLIEAKELYGIHDEITKFYIKKYNTNIITLGDIDISEIKKIWEKEVLKVIKIKTDNIVNTNNLVLKELKSKFKTNKANCLYAFWVQLSTKGEEFVKINYSRATYYRYKKELIESNISWNNTDIEIKSIDEKVLKFVPSLKLAFTNNLNSESSEYRNGVFNILSRKVV